MEAAMFDDAAILISIIFKLQLLFDLYVALYLEMVILYSPKLVIEEANSHYYS